MEYFFSSAARIFPATSIKKHDKELSKETYNALNELRAVLESQAWDDAAELVSLFDPQAAPGLAPYLNDRALLTSLPVAVELARED